LFKVNDVIRITKKSRVKSKVPVAIKGENYLITSVYINSYGTQKLYLKDKENSDYIVSANAAEFLFNLEEKEQGVPSHVIELWSSVKKNWINENYEPVTFNHYYDWQGYPMIFSRDNSAALVSKTTSIGETFWLNIKNVHPDDKLKFTRSHLKVEPELKDKPSGEFTVRIPKWLNKKLS